MEYAPEMINLVDDDVEEVKKEENHTEKLNLELNNTDEQPQEEVLSLDPADQASASPCTDDEDAALEACEAEAEKENDDEWAEENARELKEIREISEAEVVSRLERLLEKASQYTKFLERKLMSIPTEDSNSLKRRKVGNGNRKQVKAPEPEPSNGQPASLTGGQLRDYQVAGYKWMLGLYENGLHGILADEMGLGKTVQTIALIADLREKGVYGPYLLVAPLSTLTNWIAEIRKWTPSMPVLQYHGSKEERAEMRRDQLDRFKGRAAGFPVLVTTYEIVCRDRKDLQRYNWKYIIVDEGHRLKNHKCRLFKELNMLCGGSVLRGGANKLLLTGTPLQNNLTELWSLLNFLMPEIFDNVDFFLSVFDFDGVGSSENDQAILRKHKEQDVVTKLHKLLAPFMMRRLKADVAERLPQKKEMVLYVPMTEPQQDMYESIVKGELARVLEQCTGQKTALNNLMMQLRKCSLHPFLHFEAASSNGMYVTDQTIIESSGKLRCLDQMLMSLKSNGHKVLIFSQFTSMLDIIQDYMEALRPSWRICRIDGSTKLEERKQQMDSFNHDPEYFCFLLSTRAGGVGINLIAADTVIVFDSDWNPHQDNQAQDRCHRIGQTKDVMVYRLITSRSVELKILERANSKRKLERVVCAKQSTINHSSKSNSLSLEELRFLLQNDFTGHLADAGDITPVTLKTVLNRKTVFDPSFPVKGKGYEIVDHKASSLTGIS